MSLKLAGQEDQNGLNQSSLPIKKLFTLAHIFEWKRETTVPVHGEWQ